MAKDKKLETVSSGPAAATSDSAADNVSVEPKKKKHHIVRWIVIVLCVLIVAAIVILLVMVFRGAIAPSDAAAKYDTLSYIREDEVTDYVETYREQMGYADSDDGWAEFLGENGLTPDIMRSATIRQLIIDSEVDKKASQLGLTVDEEAVDEQIDTLKGNIGLGSEDIWTATLESYGTTEEAVRETYAQTYLQNAVCEAEVPLPSVSDEEIFDYLMAYYPDGVKAKHIYYLKIPYSGDEGSLEELGNVQQIQKILASMDDLTPEIFADYVTTYCTDEDLIARGGANGWSLDIGDYSQNYQAAVEDTKKGEVSRVFKEDGFYSIIWIDDVVKLPNVSDEDPDEINQEEYLSVLPDTLKSYFSDCTAQIKWESDCQNYLGELYTNSNPVLYPLSTIPPYYVDMSDVEIEFPDEYTSDETETEDDESQEVDDGTSNDENTENDDED